MDPLAWTILSIALAAVASLIVAAPALKRDQRKRQLEGKAPSGGLGSGMDAVWRPSAEDAHADWESQLELPAPAPSPGDGGRIEEGRLVIEVPPES
ncbi:hypothetical protein [Microbacterium sp. SS28]|uniref:hypothetical protein n=1 Tax=Microbacterium sp. SS28 TaxID=2919948 RepID=UPI001FAAC024|nr:hypothetical protein [Microbacterium sp. SS28]